MAIQWFPGHMHKARKEMAEVLHQVDLVLQILDARIPFSSENPMLAKLAADKPIVRILNKSDLADPEQTQIWINELCSEKSQDALAVSASDPKAVKTIMSRLKSSSPPQASSHPRPRIAMIVGIPNVGKSTLINLLAGRAITKTGNEPAITRQQQVIKLNEAWSLRDTPGVLWPKVENEASGYRLAATGAVRDTAMNSAEVAASLLDYVIEAYPDLLRQRFGDHLALSDSLSTMEAIGRDRGCLGAGALVDFDRVGRLVLQEFRDGLIGKITLETIAMRDQEIAQTEQLLAARQAKRLQRNAARKKKRASRKQGR